MTDMSQAIAAAQRSKAPRDVVQTFLAFSGKDTVRQAAKHWSLRMPTTSR